MVRELLPTMQQGVGVGKCYCPRCCIPRPHRGYDAVHTVMAKLGTSARIRVGSTPVAAGSQPIGLIRGSKSRAMPRAVILERNDGQMWGEECSSGALRIAEWWW